MGTIFKQNDKTSYYPHSARFASSTAFQDLVSKVHACLHACMYL